MDFYLCSFTSEIPKHASPTDKSGKNRFGPEKHLFPPDRMSGIVPMLRMLKPFPMLGLKFKAGGNPWEKTEKKGRYRCKWKQITLWGEKERSPVKWEVEKRPSLVSFPCWPYLSSCHYLWQYFFGPVKICSVWWKGNLYQTECLVK